MRENYLLRHYTLICFAFLLMFISCSKEPVTESVVNIKDQYELKIFQELSPEGGIPALQISSIEPLECINSYISYQTLISDGKLHIFLHDILTEGECEAGSEVISENVSISILDSSIPIEIDIKNIITNRGTLYTDGYEFDLKLNKFDGLKISKTRINKILPKMIWGSYATYDDEVLNQIQSYLQDINTSNANLKGDYGHFYLAQDNSVLVYEHEELSYYNTFMITNENDIADFESKFLEFKQLDPSLTLQATNFDGNIVIIE